MDSLQRWRLFRQKAGAVAKTSGGAANVSSEGSKGMGSIQQLFIS